MSQIVPLITIALRDHLKAVCQTAIDPSDPTYAHHVKIERYQSDPVKENVQLAVAGGSLDDPNYIDGIVTLDQLDDMGFYVPAREVGGGQLWWRRGVVQIGIFWILDRFDEEPAQDYAYIILGRVEANIENLYVASLVDDYGERAIQMFCYGNEFFRSGGPPNNYLYRGKVYWQCLTERP